MNKLYNSFRIKITLACMTILVIVMATVHTAVYITAKNIVVEQLCLSSKSTAVAISRYIMEDVASYKGFMDDRNVESGYYRKMQEYFTAVKEVSAIKYIYTERKIDEETVEFLLDAEPVDSENYSPPGSTTFMDDASRVVYDTGLSSVLEPTASDFGTLLGGCAPIFDTDGSILGLAGVNMDASNVVGHLNRLQITMFVIYIITSVLVFMLVAKYSGTILEPMLKDKLTGAYSKRYIDKLMQDEMNAAARNGTELALLMCDLDHFKNINDTYGHAFGDVILAAVSKTIISCLRKTDYFFRYGGEEFVVILAKTDKDMLMKIAERIRTAVEKTETYNKDTGTYIKMTISIGASYLNVSENLIEAADKALYDAKKTRNSVSIFNDAEDTRSEK